jgi:HSP20 family protein
MATQDKSRQQSSYMPSQGAQQGGGRDEAVQQGREVQSQRDERSLAPRQGTYVGRNYGSSPFALMRRLSDDMDRLFENFGGGLFSRGWPFAGSSGAFPESATFWSPDIEMYEEQGKLVVEAELPGMRKEDVQVQLEGDAIIVSGERRHESKDRQAGRYMSERSYGTFHRMITLPEGADTETANATFRDGILRIEMPFNQRQRGRKLEIGDPGASRQQLSQGGTAQGASNSAQPNARGDDGAPTG